MMSFSPQKVTPTALCHPFVAHLRAKKTPTCGQKKRAASPLGCSPP